MAGVRVEVLGLTHFRQAMDKLGSLNTTALLWEVGEVLHDDVLERFDAGLAPDGTAWEESQRALNDGGKTLVDTAILRDSFHPEVSGDELLYGSPEVYAAIQHFGGKTGQNHNVTLPAREIIGLDIKQLNLIEDTATSFLQELLP